MLEDMRRSALFHANVRFVELRFVSEIPRWEWKGGVGVGGRPGAGGGWGAFHEHNLPTRLSIFYRPAHLRKPHNYHIFALLGTFSVGTYAMRQERKKGKTCQSRSQLRACCLPRACSSSTYPHGHTHQATQVPTSLPPYQHWSVTTEAAHFEQSQQTKVRSLGSMEDAHHASPVRFGLTSFTSAISVWSGYDWYSPFPSR